MPVHHDLDQRWLLLVTPDTVVVPVGDRRGDAITALRALPAGTVVALVGGRRLGWLAWRGRLRRSFERYNELANAVARRLDMPMPEIDLGSLREVPWAPRRTVAPPVAPGKG